MIMHTLHLCTRFSQTSMPAVQVDCSGPCLPADVDLHGLAKSGYDKLTECLHLLVGRLLGIALHDADVPGRSELKES